MNKRTSSEITSEDSYIQLNITKKRKFNRSTCESTIGDICILQKFDPKNISKVTVRNEEEFPNLKKFVNLCELRIKNCKFTEIPEYVGYLTHLSKIKIKNTPIKDLSTLDNTHITNIPKLPYKLTVLKINKSFLTSLPESIGCTSNLRVLQISNSKLSSIPEKISKMYELKILDLHNNQITSVDLELPHLEHLNLSMNEIKEFGDKAVPEWNSLKTVDLSFNGLSKIPHNILESCCLTYLNISNNNIKELDEKIYDFETHITIDVSYNNINLERVNKNLTNKPFICLSLEGNNFINQTEATSV